MTQALISRLTLAFLLSVAAAGATPTGEAQAPKREAPVTRSAGDALQWGPCPAIFPSGCEIAVLHGDPAKLPHEATCMSTTPCVLFIAFEGPVDALAHAGLDD